MATETESAGTIPPEHRKSCADPSCSEPRKEDGYFCGSEHNTDTNYERPNCPHCDARCARKGSKWICPRHGTVSQELIDISS